MTNHKGSMISIHDETGITIESANDIKIDAKGQINISSIEQTLVMNAAEQIDIGQGGTRLTINDDISFKGGKMKME